MLSMWCRWWKIQKRCERPLRGSRITRQLLFVHLFPPKCISVPGLHQSCWLIRVTSKDPGADVLSVWSSENVGWKQRTLLFAINSISTHNGKVSVFSYGMSAMLNSMKSECFFDVMVSFIITHVGLKYWDKYIRSFFHFLAKYYKYK